MQMRFFIFGTLFIPALLACANTETETKAKPKGIAEFANDPRLGEKIDKICFLRAMRGFKTINDRTILLRKNRKERYAIETYGTCMDLDFAWELGFLESSTCLRTYDRFVITRGTSAPIERTCTVKSIHKWNEAAKDTTDKPQEDRP